MSIPAPPSTSAAAKQPFEYSQTPDAIRLRKYRAAEKETEAALLRSPECHNSVASNSDAQSKIVRQKRKRSEDYSQSRSAVAHRERQDKMTVEEREKMLKSQGDYYAITHPKENQEGFEGLGDAEQQNDEEARTTQDRSTPNPKRRSTRLTSCHENEQHTVLSTDTTPITSGAQSTLRPSDVIAQPHSTDQQDHQRLPQRSSDHPILGLEAFISCLSAEDAAIAPQLFKLVRAGHSTSGDYVLPLKKLFAQRRGQLDRDWAMIEQKERAFAETENDIFQYEVLVEVLDDATKTETVRAILHLVRVNFKDNKEAAGTLYNMFLGQKEVHKDQRARVLEERTNFEKVDEVTH